MPVLRWLERIRRGAALWPALWSATCLLLIVPAQVVALDDPTRPPGTGSSSQEQRPLPNLSLESILISTNRRVAVINGQALVEGQTVDGVRVRQIHRDRVEVTASGQVKVLHLNKLPQIRGFQ